jgi:KaiC/GvpD/RAD55 family RecA-like ATPase
MITGTPLSATLTTTQKGDPVIYVSVKSDADGYVYSSTFGLSSENARELTKKVMAYLGYNSASDNDYSKLTSGDSVDSSKSIEFDLKETIGADGKNYKNLMFPTLSSFTGKPKNMLTKDSANMLIATHNLKEFFAGIKQNESVEIPF